MRGRSAVGGGRARRWWEGRRRKERDACKYSTLQPQAICRMNTFSCDWSGIVLLIAFQIRWLCSNARRAITVPYGAVQCRAEQEFQRVNQCI